MSRCPEAEDGIHEGDLDFTEKSYGSYRGTRVEGNTMTVESWRYKTWDSDTEEMSFTCDLCGQEIEVNEDIHLDWQ